MRPFKMVCSVSLGLLLVACGSSDSDDVSSYTSSYLQFYNGSTNSPSIRFYADDTLVGTSSFADATSLLSFTAETEVELTWSYESEDNSDIEILQESRTLATSEKNLIVLTGDFNNPEWYTISFDREDLDEGFRIILSSVISGDTQYDFYLAEAGAPISDAWYGGTVGYQQQLEVPYPDATDDEPDWPFGDYVIYLTEPGQLTPVFESSTLNFAYQTEYVLILRESAGALKNQLSIDTVINSSSVSNLTDINSSAQYRIYNSLDNEQALVTSLTDNLSFSENQQVAANSLGDFTLAAYGDYRISATLEDMHLDNRLMSLNQGQSKALIFYQNEDNQLDVVTLAESELPQVYEHDLRLLNLVSEFSDIDLYFVKQDQTIETTSHYYKGLDFAEPGSYSLPLGYYEIVAVYEDAQGNMQLLDRTETLQFEQSQHYIISLEADNQSATGYRLQILH